MVFENIVMRNPGFLFEDARHGYIQYIRYALDWAMCLRCHRFVHYGEYLSECYFAGKGAALVLPPNERARPSRRVSSAGCDIQQHLQSMFYLLRPEETLKMAVKLESVHPGRTRYLVVVSCTGRQDAEESCLLGIDCHAKATVGLVLRVLADTAITLDGDGGFSVSVCGRQHIFKPVSVQAMWSALQTLHKVSSKAREQNYFLGGLSHDWVSYYEQRIESDRSCLNEWHTMDNLESRRPPSPDSERSKPREREETERVIRSTLKEIMMSVDLDEVTSKYIRGRLEEDLDMDLGEFKPFIDQEMLTILGQMDAPTEIFEHVYLGSEWNASNLEELQKNGVRHILNVTREIDNFFPGMFNYLNVRVYDDEKTDLLKHWDDTFKYITKAKKEGSKVLVHCKMGVSRSASVVIAYAMKAYNWDYMQALKHVKNKRSCIKPNSSFVSQLETYQGILDAMKNKEKLQRSKSDTNLKSPTMIKANNVNKKEEKIDNVDDPNNLLKTPGNELKKNGSRPKSWSPDAEVADNMLPAAVSLSQSLERLDNAGNSEITREDLLRGSSNQSNNKTSVSGGNSSEEDQEARNVLMPCDNGQSYSVSQNKIVHLPGPDTPSVKHRVNELETQGQRRKGLVLNLTNQFEAANTSSKPSSPGSDTIENFNKPIITENVNHGDIDDINNDEEDDDDVNKIEDASWDPGDNNDGDKKNNTGNNNNNKGGTVIEKQNNSECLVWTASAEYKCNTNNLIRDNSSSSNNSNDDDIVESCVNISDDNNGECLNGGKATTTATATTTTLYPNILSRRLITKKEGDPFSAQLDRFFDREERRGGVVVGVCGETTTIRESPSRQSSWSSCDSAIMLDNNSVHSSWATLPSRNSSWGSYDMRPSSTQQDPLGSSGLFPYDKEEIPWHPGTVKRTKQKLEESNTNNVNGIKRVCCTQNLDVDDNDKSERSTINTTTSAPAVVTGEEETTVEIYNPVLFHYTASPTPIRRDSPPTINESSPKIETVRDAGIMVAAGGIDIKSCGVTNTATTSVRQIARLSTSAPAAPSSLSSDSDLPSPLRSCRSESETNSPCVVNTSQCPSVKHHKMVLENLNNKTIFNKRCLSVDDSPESECPRSSSGIVKNLKKEFEAKSTKLEKSPDNNDNSTDNSPLPPPPSSHNNNNNNNNNNNRQKKDNKIRSLPSSPVIAHSESKIQCHNYKERESKKKQTEIKALTTKKKSSQSVVETAEDLSVKVLVGKYEFAKLEPRRTSEIQLRIHKDKDKDKDKDKEQNDTMEIHPPAKSKIAPELSRRSAPNIINHSSLFPDPPEAPGRPPSVPSPSVVVASVVAKAASKKQQQQHGRSHPLAMLEVRPRHNSPVYNTM